MTNCNTNELERELLAAVSWAAEEKERGVRAAGRVGAAGKHGERQKEQPRTCFPARRLAQQLNLHISGAKLQAACNAYNLPAGQKGGKGRESKRATVNWGLPVSNCKCGQLCRGNCLVALLWQLAEWGSVGTSSTSSICQ